jgi:hypothetical protein
MTFNPLKMYANEWVLLGLKRQQRASSTASTPTTPTTTAPHDAAIQVQLEVLGLLFTWL